MNYTFKPINYNCKFNDCCDCCDFPFEQHCMQNLVTPNNNCCNRLKLELCLDKMPQEAMMLLVGSLLICKACYKKNC